jgi:hypothetical protein
LNTPEHTLQHISEAKMSNILSRKRFAFFNSSSSLSPSPPLQQQEAHHPLLEQEQDEEEEDITVVNSRNKRNSNRMTFWSMFATCVACLGGFLFGE